MPETYPIREATLQAVVSYLERQPYREVVGLLQAIQNEVSAAVAAPAEPDPPAEGEA